MTTVAGLSMSARGDWSMKGRTVLFTGASRGMGRFAWSAPFIRPNDKASSC
jgi:hypothetical protein